MNLENIKDVKDRLSTKFPNFAYSIPPSCLVDELYKGRVHVVISLFGFRFVAIVGMSSDEVSVYLISRRYSNDYTVRTSDGDPCEAFRLALVEMASCYEMEAKDELDPEKKRRLTACQKELINEANKSRLR